MKNNLFFCHIISGLFLLLLAACSTPTNTEKSIAAKQPSGPYLDTKKTTTDDMKKATKPSGPYLDTKNSTSPTAKNPIIIDGCQERISVKKGETVQVLLPATAGTGYVWTLAKPSTLLSQNQTNNIKYKQEPNADPKIVGAPQKQILEFTAIAIGSETIDIIYSRSFEKNKVAKKCTITVSVQ